MKGMGHMILEYSNCQCAVGAACNALKGSWMGWGWELGGH